jgi:hypothetical protein
MGKNARVILVGLALFALGSLGVATAVTTNDLPDVSTAGPTVQRIVDGEIQTGVVESATEDGDVKRVIRWRTKEGKIATETVQGPTRTVHDTHTIHDPGETVTLPGETVTETATLPAETVTVTVTVTGDTGTAGAP